MDALNQAIAQISDVLWNSVLAVSAGRYRSLFLCSDPLCTQVRKLETAWNRVFSGFSLKRGKKAGKRWRLYLTLATEVAAQVRTDIAGCARPHSYPAAGAIFWMWLAAFFAAWQRSTAGALAQISNAAMRVEKSSEASFSALPAFKGTGGKHGRLLCRSRYSGTLAFMGMVPIRTP